MSKSGGEAGHEDFLLAGLKSLCHSIVLVNREFFHWIIIIYYKIPKILGSVIPYHHQPTGILVSQHALWVVLKGDTMCILYNIYIYIYYA